MKLTKRKGFNFFRSYYDVYNELETIEEKVAFIDALLDKQFLGINPTGLKGMAKFAYISQSHSIDEQVKGYESKMKTKLCPVDGGLDTPSVGGGQGGAVGGVTTPSVQVQGKGKGKGKVQVQVQVKKENFNFRKSLIELGASENLVVDWLQVRKKKNASNSESAFKLLKNQFQKTNLNIDKILETCIARDWKGFQSEWITNLNNNGNGKSKSELLDEDLQQWVDSFDIQTNTASHDRTDSGEPGFEDFELI